MAAIGKQMRHRAGDAGIKAGAGEDACHRCGEACHRSEPCLMECVVCALLLFVQCRPEVERDCVGQALED